MRPPLKIPAPRDGHYPEKAYGGDESSQIEDQCVGELMEACQHKDPGRFRHALEALVLNHFEDSDAP